MARARGNADRAGRLESVTTDDIKARQKWDPCHTCSFLAYIHEYIYICIFIQSAYKTPKAVKCEGNSTHFCGLFAALRAALAQNL